MENKPKPMKRGRKPKIKKPEEEVKIPKKRGRKPKNIIKNIDESSIFKFNQIKNMDNQSNNLIIHLKISSNFISKNNNLIEPFNNEFSNINKSEDFKINSFKKKEILDDNINLDNADKKSDKFMKKYNNISISTNLYDTFQSFLPYNNNWPIQSNIYCMWCSHPFDNIPCGIPTKIINEKFYLKGCYCSFNCAASHIFDKNNYTKWDEYSLLNLLAKKILNIQENIKLAPPRESLKIFGGILDIQEFRDNSNNINIDYKLNIPPMIAIIPKIEEKIINNENYIPFKNSIMDKIENINYNESNYNKMNNFMNIKIK